MALTLSGTNGVVGAGFTLDASGASVTAGVGTFSSLQGSAASLTQIPAANVVGVHTSVKVTGGNIVIGTSGQGIDFSATSDSSGTKSSELFSDYEEGSFTPTILDSGFTLTVYVADYIRIGRKVYIEMGVAVPSNSDSSALQFGGMPYTAKSSNDNTGGMHLTSTNSGRNDLFFVIRNTTTLSVGTNQNLDVSRSSYSNKQLKVSGSYIAA